MKRKNGFTLIELLAVIVILAVIALIATPLVLKYIEYSKEKSAKISAQTYAEAVEKEYVSKLTSNEKIPNGTYSIEQLDGYGVKVKGDKPEGTNDYVVLNNGNVVEYVLTIKGYVITYKDGEVVVDSVNNNNSNNSKLLDYTVTFTVDGEPYQIISVSEGQAIKAPFNELGTDIYPTSPSGNFDGWLIEGERVSFPYTPNSDVEITALFRSVRDEMIWKKGVFDNQFGNKATDEFAIRGRAKWGTGNYCYYRFAVGRTETSVSATWGSPSSFTYEGETWYVATQYSAKAGNGSDEGLHYLGVYGSDVSLETIATALLDYYYMKTN